jgi:hypothetical protein
MIPRSRLSLRIGAAGALVAASLFTGSWLAQAASEPPEEVPTVSTTPPRVVENGAVSPDLTPAQLELVEQVLAKASVIGPELAVGRAQVVQKAVWTDRSGRTIGASAVVHFETPAALPYSYEGAVPKGEEGVDEVGKTIDRDGLALTQKFEAGTLDSVNWVTVNVLFSTRTIHSITTLDLPGAK